MSEITPNVESERRLVTVMFADISGFTAMSEKMDPEEITCTMNDCFCMMGECIEQHDGTIDKFMGDCVMALFGVPKALEDAPQKAVNTAIELRNRLIQFNQEKKLAIPLNIHIGINTGEVVAGMIGSDRKQDFTVMGDTVNLASRLEDASREGQILVSPATYQATKAGFEYRPLAPITLKGKAEPVSVYELLSIRQTLFRVRSGADRMISSVMVGRDTELNRLELQVMKVVNGEGSIVNVIGEAGIGKSRLIAELKNREATKRVTVLEGRTISMGENLGYHLIIDLLKNWAQITDEDSEVAAFSKLESAIRNTCPEALGEILPFVATLMGMKLMGRYAERVKGIEGEALEKLILKNVRDLVTKGSQNRPLVIILEDLQWADTSSVELLESLFRLATRVRIVFINVFRPGYTDTGDRVEKTIQKNHPEKYLEIILQPLEEHQTDILITNLLTIRGFPHRLKEQIIERAGGNPYFIEEVIRSFIDEGAVVITDSGFGVTKKLSSMSVPRTINEVLMTRIDRLDQKTRDLVKTASVIGRSFFYKILTEVARTIDDMDSRLEYLKDIQLIRELKRMEELEYLFKHALVQEVAYDSILMQKRKELHKNVADSIEKVFNQRLHEFYGMLAYHYSQAEDLEKTEEYLIKAGEESLKVSASSEALHYYQQALDLYLGKYGDEADPEKVAMLEKNIALALFNRGKYTESVEYFDKVLTCFGEGVPTNAISKIWKFCMGFVAFLIGIYLPFLKWKKTPSSRDNEIISLFYKKLQALSVTDPQEFFIRVFHMLYRYTKYDVTKIENGTGLMAGMSIIFSWTGISFTLSRRVLKVAKDKIDMTDVRSVFQYKFSQLILSYLSGDWPEQIEFDNDLIDKNLAIGEFFFINSYIVWNLFIDTARGSFSTAQGLIQKVSDIGEIYGNDYAKVEKFLNNIYLLTRWRKLQEALVEADTGIQFITKTGFLPYLFTFYTQKAWTQFMLGDVSGSRETLGLAGRIQSHARTIPVFMCQYLLSEFVLELYQLEEAMNRTGNPLSALHHATAYNVGKEALRLSSGKVVPFKTESLKLMGVYYWIIGRQRKAMQWWRKAIAEGQRLNDRLELSRTYFEVGKRLLESKSKYKELDGIKAWDYLNKAKDMFEEMGLQWDLDELEKLKIQLGS
ncbi:MAG TPA: adenylate/guanylate cyclase domain-containing protein [Deltaproteobacteria bacterium]|nr:adenylate/guanylate cyclase domain-containing protein [Deltaproteobacteria bacterium]